MKKWTYSEIINENDVESYILKVFIKEGSHSGFELFWLITEEWESEIERLLIR